ncbi:MAG: substrate-binding domain-containing protein [Methyloceanibacter sp.]
MNRFAIAASTLGVAALCTGGPAFARDQVQIAGSSTVLPYAQIVAEDFGKTYSKFKAPVVESGGSSAGLKQFCKGVGEGTIDIANSSRQIKDNEIEACAEAGVKNIIPVRFGYDGIVFATDVNKADWALEPKDVYLALAEEVPVDGKMVKNPNKTWKDVNDKLPDWKIVAYIPGEKHGTREVFDGDYTETLARLQSNPEGVGVFGLSFYENNTDKLKVATMSGITPSVETISSGEYPVSRPLFFYVKKDHIGVIPGLKEYVEFFTSEKMIGPDGPLADYGLVPLPENELEALQEEVKEGKVLSM